MQFKIICLAAFFGIAALNTAHAGLLSCSIGPPATTYSLDSATAAACFSGNDSNQIDSSFLMFGMSGWTLADKNDDTTSGDGVISFTTSPLNGVSSGDWGVSTITGYDVVVTLKAASSFGAFLIDSMGGTWSSSKNLSHSSIYYRTATPPPPSVPEPGSLGLLALGLVGLGLARRRQA